MLNFTILMNIPFDLGVTILVAQLGSKVANIVWGIVLIVAAFALK